MKTLSLLPVLAITFLALGPAVAAQTRVSIPSGNLPYMDLVEISLAPGQARQFVLAARADTVIKVALDTDNSDGSGFIKLLNGVKGTDIWKDDVNGIEVLAGRDSDYIFEVKNISRKTYPTFIYFSFDKKENYQGLSSRDVPRARNIREVDFGNFIYEPVWVGDVFRRIKVSKGNYEKVDDTGREFLTVDKPVYGDIDGDGREEALINSDYWPGGSGVFSELFVYTIRARKPVLMARMAGGDRAFGGIRRTRLKNGIVSVEFSDAGSNGGACCSEFVVTRRYRWDGDELQEVGPPIRRALYAVTRVRFDKGSFRKNLTTEFSARDREPNDRRRFIVRAKKGQNLTVTTDSTDVSAYLNDGDADITKTASGFSARLKNDGDYVFHIEPAGSVQTSANINIEIR